MGGTNCHLLLCPPPKSPEIDFRPVRDVQVSAAGAGGGVVAWVISAKSEAALRAQAERLGAWVGERPEADVADVGFSLATGRSGLEYRGAVIGSDSQAMVAGLSGLADGQPAAQVVTGRATAGKVAFVFPGQGGQWERMAVELLDSSPVFAAHMKACAEALAPHVDWSLEAVLRGSAPESSLTRVDVIQPALFAVMVSLAALWRSCGVRPAMVIGHSQGEIAAAYVAGALTLDDAAHVVSARSRAIAELGAVGAMASIGLPAAQLNARLEGGDGRISVAAWNSPTSTVISGEPVAVQEFVGACEAEGVFARVIPVDYASHSAQIEPVREQLVGALSSITPRAGEIPFYSTVSGTVVDAATLDGEHWYRNLRQPVQFEQGTAALLNDGVHTFIEMGPHPVLAVAITESAEAHCEDPSSVAVLGSLRREEGDWQRFLTSLAEAHVHGVGVDWATVFAPYHPHRVELPTYPFQRQRYWLGARAAGAGDLGSVGLSGVGHPFLGAGVRLGSEQGWVFTGRLSLQTHPWLADHQVFDAAVLPGAALVEMALAAGAWAGLDRLEELVVEAPLVVPEHSALHLQLLLGQADEEGRWRLGVYSRFENVVEEAAEHEPWVLNAIGVLATDTDDAADSEDVPMLWPPADTAAVDTDELYDRLAEAGLHFGPAFRCVRALWRRDAAGPIHRPSMTIAKAAKGQAKRPLSATKAASVAKHPFLAIADHPSGPEESRPKQRHSRRRPRARLTSTAVLNTMSTINASTDPYRVPMLPGTASNSAAMLNSVAIIADPTSATKGLGTPKASTARRAPPISASFANAATANSEQRTQKHSCCQHHLRPILCFCAERPEALAATLGPAQPGPSPYQSCFATAVIATFVLCQ
jgi:acyl transferase domain-containing protein